MNRLGHIVARKAYEDFIMSFMPTSDSLATPYKDKLEQAEKSLSKINKYMSTDRDANRALFIIHTIIEMRTYMIMKEHC